MMLLINISTTYQIHFQKHNVVTELVKGLSIYIKLKYSTGIKSTHAPFCRLENLLHTKNMFLRIADY